jgi:leucyl/phenylalanyl-tRNA--protein transferase
MIELYQQGYAHSVEVWQDEKLVGGLYGVSLGGYFTIESQFSFVKDTSKVIEIKTYLKKR